MKGPYKRSNRANEPSADGLPVLPPTGRLLWATFRIDDLHGDFLLERDRCTEISI
jgi:hypothetical protein